MFVLHMEKMIKIPIEEFEKIQAIKSTIDLDLLEQFVSDIKVKVQNQSLDGELKSWEIAGFEDFEKQI